jgi:hypothetical protein
VFGKLARTLGDLGGAEAGLNEDVSALGTEGSSDSPSEGVDTSEESSTALNTELELLYSLLEDNSMTMTSQYHHTL